MLNVQLVKTSATPNDFTFGLKGEFTAKGRGTTTPFHPFPMKFPFIPSNRQMLEALISDYAINSLLYIMHERDFFTFRIGPDTPTIGEFLRTSCSDDDFDDFDNWDVDDEEISSEEESSLPTITTTMSSTLQNRSKRDTNEATKSADLGICLSDIMPAIRDKFPNRLLNIKIHTLHAPSVIFESKNGGVANVNLDLEALLYIDDTGERIGRIIIDIVIAGNVRLFSDRISAVIEIKSLNLTDNEQTLGLSEEALTSLASLSKDILSKIANDKLSKGLTLQMPTAKLPLILVKPQFVIIDHAIHLATNFKLSAKLFGITSSSICRRF
ncbi:unnamed protein product [Thelazia callipaeda]|uniref:BPI2 domain-containing protein n=1 Tax=Thelazia callipaeda TaxID=103827 RepID=A0A0N5CJU2_THECL|nr:unnamed protein product [Thelazia callipaeda]